MRTILLATLLAGCAWSADASAQAAAGTWAFSYTGFNLTRTHTDFFARQSVSTTEFEPDLTLTGRFSGADNDHDGVIELSELTGFEFNGEDYHACQLAPGPHESCGVENFSYALTGQLDFLASDAGGNGSSEGSFSHAASGVLAYTGSFYGTEQDELGYAWTGQTTFKIAQLTSPVPEPASAGMAAAGVLVLGMLGLSGRRRRGLTGRV